MMAAASADGERQSAHYFTREDDGKPSPEVLANILQQDLMNEPPSLIVCSGDVGWSGAAEDYEYATTFFSALRKWWPLAAFVVAAGNHDVSFDAKNSADRQDEFIRLLRVLHGQDFTHRYPYLDLTDHGLSKRQRLIDFLHIDDQALVVAVNSAAYMNDTANKGFPVFVGPGELRLIADRVASLNIPQGLMRIFVVHHHLFPFATPAWQDVVDASKVPDRADLDIVANSAKFQAWLAENQFELVLHGHKHLSHSRDDTLRRKRDPDGCRLVVVGAGSAGVGRHHRVEALTYNVIDAEQIGTARWSLSVDTREISEDQAVHAAAPYYRYDSEIGPTMVPRPSIFSAERMDSCHHAIEKESQRSRRFLNFVSVVESHEYVHPQTARIGSTFANKDDVERSFRALHPEWQEQGGWDKTSQVDPALQDLAAPYQFQHGPRLFGVLGRSGLQFRGVRDVSTLQPIRHAVASLDYSDTRAYIGLYNAEIDLTSDRQPLPGLMSVQFVPDGDFLDIVATFRKLELSFWWVVNMYEMGALLRWAAQHETKRRHPRRITFFAPIAEWKENPEVARHAMIDTLPLNELTKLVLLADRGQQAGLEALSELLRDKMAWTSEVNINQSGLERLAQLIDALKSVRTGDIPQAMSPFSDYMQQRVNNAVEQTRFALSADQRQRNQHLDEAQKHLSEVLRQLTATPQR
jgi:hypothetical protein